MKTLVYHVPVYVEIDEGAVTRVQVDDGASIRDGNPCLCAEDQTDDEAADKAEVERLIEIAENGQAWPAWEWL